MLSLHTNAASLFTKSNLSASQTGLTTSMTRLGTGLRINSAMDDAAGLQIATRLEAQSRGMGAAMKNAQNGISMLQTADGALSEVSNIMLRMKDLATESANGTASTEDKAALKAEFDALGAEMDNILNNTTFGGAKLLAGGKLAAAVDFQIGATAAEKMTLDVSAALEEVTKPTDIGAAADIDAVSASLDKLGTLRSAIGANANRLNHVYNNLANVNNNTQVAKGRIMDTDFATESAAMTSKQMLMQAGTAMLKQSGSMSQMAMSLLQ